MMWPMRTVISMKITTNKTVKILKFRNRWQHALPPKSSDMAAWPSVAQVSFKL